jgi:uncharacterized membrane protein
MIVFLIKRLAKRVVIYSLSFFEIANFYSEASPRYKN